MRSKEELLKRIHEIDEQLEENRSTLEPYFGKEVEVGSSIHRLVEGLVEVTKLLLEERIKMRNELLKNYGIFII